MRFENPADGEKREIREMLVVDRVELVSLNQPVQVWKLHRDHTALTQQHLEACHEIVQFRHMGEHVVADQQIGLTVLRGDVARGLLAEESDQGWYALPSGLFCDIRRGLDP